MCFNHALLIDLMEEVIFTFTAFRALLFTASGKTTAERFYRGKRGKKSKTRYYLVFQFLGLRLKKIQGEKQPSSNLNQGMVVWKCIPRRKQRFVWR